MAKKAMKIMVMAKNGACMPGDMARRGETAVASDLARARAAPRAARARAAMRCSNAAPATLRR